MLSNYQLCERVLQALMKLAGNLQSCRYGLDFPVVLNTSTIAVRERERESMHALQVLENFLSWIHVSIILYVLVGFKPTFYRATRSCLLRSFGGAGNYNPYGFA